MGKTQYTRRAFLGKACAAVGYTTLFSSLINLKAMAAAAFNNSGSGDEYKAMVFILLHGGNDSFNMLIPRSAEAYNEYAATRSNLAIPQNQLLTINPLVFDGRDYGLHPTLSGIQNLFENNKLAFVCNVGTLVEPATKQQIYEESVQTPLGLFSHSDQQQQWQSGRPHERTNIGWGGRIADLVHSVNPNEEISMNISLNGINVFQYGQEVIPYVINESGSIGLMNYNAGDLFHQLRSQAVNSMLERDYSDVFKNTYVNTVKTSNDASFMFQSAIDAVPDFTTPFVDNELSRQLRMVAKTIAARNSLGAARQIFFVQLGDWDHHDELLVKHTDRLTALNDAVTYFQGVMEELNVAENVTSFTISDFARTLTSNGNGTDHAWGGNAFVFGGPVNGRKLYGTFPSLALNSELDLFDGVLIPTTATDLYFAELAKWFGLSNSDINMIFPNLTNFFDLNTGGQPLGFMNL
ncbi:MAG: DUF1501 domain-containing protein [Bacteroidales bacterium]|nr:DUF1501 domain-containing protein [Bacteroidales bacterium]